MAQIFRKSSNGYARALILGTPVVLALVVTALYAAEWSPWATREYAPIDQPVPFSHKHHVGQLGIDCRYCHVGVEKSAYAGLPPTETCMSCHSQLYTDQAMLEPVRKSLAENKPIVWNRVHDLPDFVYFNHSIHVNKGIGCTACHGNMADNKNAFSTERVALKDEGKYDEAKQLVKDYHILSSGVLTDCYTCHR